MLPEVRRKREHNVKVGSVTTTADNTLQLEGLEPSFFKCGELNRITSRGKFFEEKLAGACIYSMLTIGVG